MYFSPSREQFSHISSPATLSREEGCSTGYARGLRHAGSPGNKQRHIGQVEGDYGSRIVGKLEVTGVFPDPPGPRSLSNRFVVYSAIPFSLRSDLLSRWPAHVRSSPRRPSLPSPPPTCVGAADCPRRTPRDSSPFRR